MSRSSLLKVDETQTRELFKRRYQRECARVNKFMTRLMLGQWLAGSLIALLYAPNCWMGDSPFLNLHLWFSIICGGVVSGLAIFCVRRFPNSIWARHIVAACQLMWSILLIHVTGGRIETHFHVFASLAILSLYRDWKLLVTATLVVTIDHIVRGVFFPLSVYGVSVTSPFRWVEHSAWMIFEVSFLIPGCIMLRKEIYELCRRQTELVHARVTVDQKVKIRTRELETANRKLASKTREAETLALVARYTDNLVIITDGDGKIEWVNDGFQRVTGYTLKEVLGCSKTEILNGPETDHEQIAVMEDAFRNKQGFDAEMLRYRKDGTAFWMAIESRPIRNSKDEVQRFILVESDITKRVEAEKERQKLNDQLVEASRIAGIAEVATGVLHNIGNELNSVNVSTNVIEKQFRESAFEKLERVGRLIEEHEQTFSDFVRSDQRGRNLPRFIIKLVDVMKEERSRICDEIQDLTSHIDMIKDIVSVQQSMARTEGLKQQFKISDVVADAIAASHSSIKDCGVEVVTILDSECSNVESDRQKVLQILINLVSNAIDAMAEQVGSDSVLEISTASNPRFSIVKVRDNGPGIERENLHRIFQHGYTTKSGCHGFGLHYCANSATEIGGKVTVESEGIGRGAEFQLWIPNSRKSPSSIESVSTSDSVEVQI